MTQDVLVVVPSERQVERLVRSGRRAITRERLRVHLFETVERDRVLASPLATRLALAEAIARVAPRDPLLLSSVREGGEAWGRTVEAIDAAIGALRRAGTSEESLARVAQGERGAVGGRARLLRDVLRALDATLDARGLVDPRAIGPRLARAIAAAPSSRVREAIGGTAVVARFVHDWDGGDAAWWRALDEALAREGGGARVELPSFDEEARIDASRESGPLDIVIDDVARALDAPPMTSSIEPTVGDLRNEGACSAEVLGRVRLCAANDADGQARAVAHAVREALAAGVAVDAIAIGAAELGASSLGSLRRAFEASGVPLVVVGRDTSASRMVAFAMSALAVGERGLPRVEVAALVRSSYVDPLALARSPGALLDLARALERTPTASADDARSALRETARASSDDPAVGAARAEIALRVADILLPASRSASRAVHVSSARALFAALGLEASAARAARRMLGPGAPERSGAERRALTRDVLAWSTLDAGLSDLETSARQLGLEGSRIDPRAFRQELACALEERRGSARASAAAVVVGTLEELAGEEPELLVVIDASEGSLPSHGDASAVLAESVAPALRRIEPARAPPSFAVRSARSLAALAAAANRARRVVFARRARDEEGAAVAPSPVVEWLERGGAPSVVWRGSPLDGPVTSGREARLRRAARAALGDGDQAARRARVERARESRFEWTNAPRAPVLGDLDLEAALDPRLLDALVAETGGGARPLAVTSLERFAACPFQGFAQQVLHARRTRPLREIPDARESGTLLHRALAAAFRESAGAWRERPRDAPRIRAEALAACDRVLRAESVASSLRRLAVARIREAVVATLEWSLADESWDFARAEQAFGERRSGAREDAWPALVLADGATRLALGGSIDRVDTGHGRAAVRAIDYKLSRSGAEGGMRGLGETAFQIALYAHAAADALHVAERAGEYVAATRPDAVGPKLRKDFEAKWAALHAGGAPITPLESRALGIVRQVRLGSVAPRPFEEGTCTHCDSSGACRKPRFAVARDDDGGAA